MRCVKCDERHHEKPAQVVIFGHTKRTERSMISGYLACIAVGISLGLIGGGGSILMVPILVYLFGFPPTEATFYSLFVVGITSAVGSMAYFRQNLVVVRMAVLFGIPSLMAVFFTRWWLLPALPEELLHFSSFVLTKSTAMLLLFAALMVVAAYSMLRKPANQPAEKSSVLAPRAFAVVAQGLLIGLLTGLVGAGGGFLIIPALVFLCQLTMKQAIGTSLLIISANTLFGFFTTQEPIAVQWNFLLTITSFALLGIVVGTLLGKKVEGHKLKPAFGWLVLALGTFIILREPVFS